MSLWSLALLAKNLDIQLKRRGFRDTGSIQVPGSIRDRLAASLGEALVPGSIRDRLAASQGEALVHLRRSLVLVLCLEDPLCKASA